MELDSLIAALASPPGTSERGIIRLGGANLRALLESCFAARDRSSLSGATSPRRWAGEWKLSTGPARLACALMFWPTARSYTGQPTAELHLPGSPPVLEHVLQDLYRRGVRPARRGEFTLRAFLAGKLDLVQAEAVLGVIDAPDDVQLRTALEQLAGGISGRLAELRFDLMDLLADLEAGLDFVEEDIEFVSRGEFCARIGAARRFVEALRSQAASRMTSAARPKVVLAGLPNAGKSTLFNRLAEKSLALVSAEEGTTRDYLQADVVCRGMELELVDTAGWELADQGISAAAQGQRADQFRRAALIVWCSAGDQDVRQLQDDDAAFRQSQSLGLPLVRIRTKRDLSVRDGSEPAFGGDDLWISARTDAGLTEFQTRIHAQLTAQSARTSAWLGMTAARCGDSLEQAAAALSRAEVAAGQPAVGEELLAVELRESLDHLGTIVGAVYTDDLLDRIFSKFCIGK